MAFRTSCCYRASLRILAAITIVVLGGSMSPKNGFSDCLDYEDYLHWVGGVDTQDILFDVSISGLFAYVASYELGLRVIDLTNPVSPAIVATLDTPGNARGIAVSGTSAYVADGSGGLHVIDITNPLSPAIVGSLETSGFTGTATVPSPIVIQRAPVVVSGSYVYLADMTSGVHVIDVSNPSGPIEVSSLGLGASEGIAVSGSYAYFADGYAGLHVVSISDPQSPVILSNVDTGLCSAVAASGAFVYVADDIHGLQVIDVTDPGSPLIVGSSGAPASWSGAEAVAISGSYAYVAGGYPGVQVVDISNPDSPVVVGVMRSPGTAHAIGISGSHAFFGTSFGLQTVDISNPVSVSAIGSLEIPNIFSSFNRVAVSGSYAYVASQKSGLYVIDISTPESPSIAGSATWPTVLGGQIWGIAVSESHAYIAVDVGLEILEITDPSSPVFVGHLDLPRIITGVSVSGSYAYLTQWPNEVDSGLQIIDVSTPSSPIVVGSVKTPGGAGGVAVSGAYVYVASASAGLRVIDVTNVISPKIVGTVDTPGLAWNVALSSGYAYVADGVGLQIIDVTDPASPARVGSVDTAHNVTRIAVLGDRAYLAGESGVEVVDIANVTCPKLVGVAGTLAYSVAVSSTHLLATDHRLNIFPLQCSSGCSVPLEAMGADPNTLNTGGQGNYITAHIELPPDYDLAQVNRSTIHLNQCVSPVATSFEVGDWNHNQVLDLGMKFFRDEVEGTLGEGDHVPITISGGIGESCTFIGTVYVRVIRPRIKRPNGGESFLSGQSIVVSWENPHGWDVDHTEIQYSPDGGTTWTLVADNVTNDQFTWAVPDEPTENSRLRIIAMDEGGVMGYDLTDGRFAVARATGVGNTVPTAHRLYQNFPNPFHGLTHVAFDLPVDGPVRVSVFDVSGGAVRVLTDAWYPAGQHEISWDGRDTAGRSIAAGVYFLKMQTQSFNGAKRMYLRK